MGVRGHGAEVALAFSSTLFAAGAIGNIESSRVDVNEARVDALSQRQQRETNELNTEYPEVEALYNAGNLTMPQAKELKVGQGWYELQDQLNTTTTELQTAEIGDKTLHGYGELGMALGGIGAAISLLWAKEAYGMRRYQRTNEEFELREAMKEDYNFTGEVFGIEPGEFVPAIPPRSGYYLSTFAAEEPIDGLVLFAKRNTRTPCVQGVFRVIQELEGGNMNERSWTAKTVDLLKPLFGARVTAVRGGYEASDLGKRIKDVTRHMSDLYSVSLYLHNFSERELEVLDPGDHRLVVERAAHLLDSLLPLDQSDDHNPPCADIQADYVKYGRHWIDFINNRALQIDPREKLQPVEQEV